MDRVADRVAGLQWNASEAGGGEGEGFELAGHDLVRNAFMTTGRAFPGSTRSPPSTRVTGHPLNMARLTRRRRQICTPRPADERPSLGS